MTKATFCVPGEAKGRRLDVILGELAGVSRSQAAHLIRRGHVEVCHADRRPAKKPKTGLILTGWETIAVDLAAPRPLSAAPEDLPLDIRYEDEDVLVVSKPAGLVVHPAPGHATGTLVNALAGYACRLSSVGGVLRPGIVHRLDKGTSGLLLVAKNNRAHAALARQLAVRTLSREYLALVWGLPDPPSGRIEAPIGRSLRGGKEMGVGGRSSRHAATRYETLEAYPYTSWLRIALETGRTHQIRVHLRHIGHPVVGDPQYGGREKAVSGIAPRFRAHAKSLLDDLHGQALHAWRLTFQQPTTGETVVITSEPPENIERARKRARS